MCARVVLRFSLRGAPFHRVRAHSARGVVHYNTDHRFCCALQMCTERVRVSVPQPALFLWRRECARDTLGGAGVHRTRTRTSLRGGSDVEHRALFLRNV